MSGYAIHVDVTDDLLENAADPEKVIKDYMEWMASRVLQEMTIPINSHGPFDTPRRGITLSARRYRVTQDPFDYEDEDGEIIHCEAMEFTRFEVNGVEVTI